MNGYTREELETLNRVAREWFGCRYTDLSYDMQQEVYYYTFEEV